MVILCRASGVEFAKNGVSLVGTTFLNGSAKLAAVTDVFLEVFVTIVVGVKVGSKFLLIIIECVANLL